MPIFFDQPVQIRAKIVGCAPHSCVTRQLIFNKAKDFYFCIIKMQMLNSRQWDLCQSPCYSLFLNIHLTVYANSQAHTSHPKILS